MIFFVSFATGVVLGIFFYGGLFWTVSKAVTSVGQANRNVAPWFLVSQFIRTGITVAGFYFASKESWKGLLFCFAGFLLGRVVVTRGTRPRPKTEGIHASYL